MTDPDMPPRVLRPWKAVFDLSHQFGTYYGRVFFVVARDRPDAEIAAGRAALAEYPDCHLRLIDLGMSTDAAMSAWERQRERTREWQAKRRAEQTLRCPHCNGTGQIR